MPNIPSPAPQKNPISAPQQDQEVMGLIQRGGKTKNTQEIEKAKNLPFSSPFTDDPECQFIEGSGRSLA